MTANQAAIELFHVDEFKDTGPVVIQVCSHAIAVQVIKLYQVDDHKEKEADKQKEMDYLDVDEVLGHKFTLTDGGEEANDSHYTCLHRKRDNDPHEVCGHQVGCELGHVLHILVKLQSEVSQIAVVNGHNDATNHEEKAGASAPDLFV